MSSRRALMLVSDSADGELRAAVERGDRPRPEYLVLEERHGVDLLDWSRLPGSPRGRSIRLSLRHVRTALTRIREYDVALSDGEHLGMPLALARLGLRIPTRHVVIGHRLTSPRKWMPFKLARADLGMSAIVVHSRHQMLLAQRRLGIPAERLRFVPYGVDTAFWRPEGADDRRLVVAAGREHRDYATLAAACASLDCQVAVAAGSPHSPEATWRAPAVWPAGFTVRQVAHRELRDLYAQAAVVVVPLLETDFQAGVTTLLEAMAMGKAVVVSATRGQRDVVRHRENGLLVPPGDAVALRRAIAELLERPDERRRLGSAARRYVEANFSVEAYADRLAAELRE